MNKFKVIGLITILVCLCAGTVACETKATEKPIADNNFVDVSTPSCEVFFDSNGGNAIKEITVDGNSEIVLPQEVSKEGFVFDGWFVDSTFETKFDLAYFKANLTIKRITLFAKWTVIEVAPAIKYSVNITGGTNGSVTASITNASGVLESATTAIAGDTISVTVEPKTGYRLVENSLKCNGACMASKTFVMPAENVTITAEFELIPPTVYTIEIDSKISNGAVTASKTTASGAQESATTAIAGDEISVTVTPNTGYRLKAESLKSNGVCIASNTFVMPAENVTITAEFELIPPTVYTITIDGEISNGAVTASKTTVSGVLESATTAIAGDTISVTVEPNEGYRLQAESLKSNGVCIASNTFVMPAENVIITAEFELIPPTVYTITIDSIVVNGAVTASKTTASGVLESATTAIAGDEISVTVEPNEGYRLQAESLKCNGVCMASKTFVMPAENVTITAIFELKSTAIKATIDGIEYRLQNNFATVIGAQGEDLIIPPSVTYSEVEYSVTSIGQGAFQCSETLKSIQIPASVTSIGAYAFECCSNLVSVTMSDGLEIVKDGAFSYCTALKSVIFPASVTSIGAYVFDGCDSLTEVYIPQTTQYVGDCAFTNCPNLTIYTDAECAPTGWSADWNIDKRPIKWKYIG